MRSYSKPDKKPSQDEEEDYRKEGERLYALSQALNTSTPYSVIPNLRMRNVNEKIVGVLRVVSVFQTNQMLNYLLQRINAKTPPSQGSKEASVPESMFQQHENLDQQEQEINLEAESLVPEIEPVATSGGEQMLDPEQGKPLLVAATAAVTTSQGYRQRFVQGGVLAGLWAFVYLGYLGYTHLSEFFKKNNSNENNKIEDFVIKLDQEDEAFLHNRGGFDSHLIDEVSDGGRKKREVLSSKKNQAHGAYSVSNSLSWNQKDNIRRLSEKNISNDIHLHTVQRVFRYSFYPKYFVDFLKEIMEDSFEREKEIKYSIMLVRLEKKLVSLFVENYRDIEKEEIKYTLLALYEIESLLGELRYDREDNSISDVLAKLDFNNTDPLLQDYKKALSPRQVKIDTYRLAQKDIESKEESIFSLQRKEMENEIYSLSYDIKNLTAISFNSYLESINYKALYNQDNEAINQFKEKLDKMLLELPLNATSENDPFTPQEYRRSIEIYGKLKIEHEANRLIHFTRYKDAHILMEKKSKELSQYRNELSTYNDGIEKEENLYTSYKRGIDIANKLANFLPSNDEYKLTDTDYDFEEQRLLLEVGFQMLNIMSQEKTEENNTTLQEMEAEKYFISEHLSKKRMYRDIISRINFVLLSQVVINNDYRDILLARIEAVKLIHTKQTGSLPDYTDEQLLEKSYELDINEENGEFLMTMVTIYHILQEPAVQRTIEKASQYLFEDMAEDWVKQNKNLSPLNLTEERPKNFISFHNFKNSTQFENYDEYIKQFNDYIDNYSGYEATLSTRSLIASLPSGLKIDEVVIPPKKIARYVVGTGPGSETEELGSVGVIELYNGNWLILATLREGMLLKRYSKEEVENNEALKMITQPELKRLWEKTWSNYIFDSKLGGSRGEAAVQAAIMQRNEQIISDFENTLKKFKSEFWSPFYENQLEIKGDLRLVKFEEIDSKKNAFYVLRNYIKEDLEKIAEEMTEIYYFPSQWRRAAFFIPFYKQLYLHSKNSRHVIDIESMISDTLNVLIIIESVGVGIAEGFLQTLGDRVVSYTSRGFVGRQLVIAVVRELPEIGIITLKQSRSILLSGLIDLISPLPVGSIVTAVGRGAMKYAKAPTSKLMKTLFESGEVSMEHSTGNLKPEWQVNDISLDGVKHDSGIYTVISPRQESALQRDYYIKENSRIYEVKWDYDAQTWRVIQSDQFYATPVKLDESGHWITHADVPGKGGSKRKDIVSADHPSESKQVKIDDENKKRLQEISQQYLQDKNWNFPEYDYVFSFITKQPDWINSKVGVKIYKPPVGSIPLTATQVRSSTKEIYSTGNDEKFIELVYLNSDHYNVIINDEIEKMVGDGNCLLYALYKGLKAIGKDQEVFGSTIVSNQEDAAYFFRKQLHDYIVSPYSYNDKNIKLMLDEANGYPVQIDHQAQVAARKDSIKNSGLSGRGSIKAGKNWAPNSNKPFGQDFDFRWIDDQISETEKSLHHQLFSEGRSAAKLREFRARPKAKCWDATVEAFDALKDIGEQPNAIGMLIYKNPWDDAPLNHFATLVKKDGADFVIDPTIQQFDPKLPNSATVLTRYAWEAVMKNKAEVGNDVVIILNVFDSPLQAKQTVGYLQSAKGKYYQFPMNGNDNAIVLKYNYKFENSIIKELNDKKNELRKLKNNSEEAKYIRQDIEKLQALKESFGLFSPQEIKPTEMLTKKLKKQFSEYTVSIEEVGALKSLPDKKGVVITASGKKYIKISEDGYLTIQEEPTGNIASITSKGHADISINFDDKIKKWILPDFRENRGGNSLFSMANAYEEFDQINLPEKCKKENKIGLCQGLSVEVIKRLNNSSKPGTDLLSIVKNLQSDLKKTGAAKEELLNSIGDKQNKQSLTKFKNHEADPTRKYQGDRQKSISALKDDIMRLEPNDVALLRIYIKGKDGNPGHMVVVQRLDNQKYELFDPNNGVFSYFKEDSFLKALDGYFNSAYKEMGEIYPGAFTRYKYSAKSIQIISSGSSPSSQPGPSGIGQKGPGSSKVHDIHKNGENVSPVRVHLNLDREWKSVAMINHSELPESTQLSQISMLGSHDAGTYAYSKSYNSVGSLLPFAFKTQNLNLREQAVAGARYFDIRVAERKNGSFGFFHGPSVTGGDAVADVRELLAYAKEDPKNFYLLKFVFEDKKNRKGLALTSSDKFLQRALQGYRDNLITQIDTQNLAMAKVKLLGKQKNLAVMVDKYHGTEQHWLYREQVYTQWANKANAQGTADFIRKFHGATPPEGKIQIIQTNMPFASVANKEITRGVESYLDNKANIIASAVDDIPNAGVISGDYIGSPKSAAERFKMKINSDNKKLISPDQL
jgi:hypothetical protein